MYHHEQGIKGFKGILAVALVFILITLLYGCATSYNFTIEKDPITENVTKIEVHTRSFREAAMFKLVYNPTTGYFEILAVGVTDDTSEVVGKAIGTVGNVATGYLNLGRLPFKEVISED